MSKYNRYQFFFVDGKNGLFQKHTNVLFQTDEAIRQQQEYLGPTGTEGPDMNRNYHDPDPCEQFIQEPKKFKPLPKHHQILKKGHKGKERRW